MIKLTREAYWLEINDSGLSGFAKEKLTEAVNAFHKGLIPPMVDNKSKFNELKAEIGPISIDGEECELTKQAMDDGKSFRVRLVKK